MVKKAEQSVVAGVLIGVVLVACGRETRSESEQAPTLSIRPASVAGRFYAGGAPALKREIHGYMDKVAGQAPAGRVVAAVAPHAGYAFSALVAAHTFACLEDVAIDTIVIIGHDAHTPGIVAYLSPDDAFQTPLGKVAVDREMVRKLVAHHPGIVESRRVHANEHTVEVQLPFLQYQGKSCRIVPVLFGAPTLAHCRILADGIAKAAGDKNVFVLASTDLSHYPAYEDARRVDLATLDALKLMDIERLFAYLDQSDHAAAPKMKTAMCARGGVGTALLFAKAHGATKLHVLKYANSGDVPMGKRDGVVGYGAAVLVATPEQVP